MQYFFSPCPRGLEPVLADELRELGIGAVHIVPGGVQFNAEWPDCYRVNLHSRIASRVLWRVVQGRYRTEEDIHKLALKQDWPALFDVTQTLRVDITASHSPLHSIEFATLRVKDGICDRFRNDVGERPSIDTRHPDVRVFCYVDEDTCVLYLDTSGEPLFKRGWRADAGDAPLRENLAAGILRLAGWKPGETLFDPMCGSGTFIVEAAQTALGIPPGGKRDFGFERLKNFSPLLWRSILDAAGDNAPDGDAILGLHASDISGDAVALTRLNLQRAGVSAELALRIAPKQIDARFVQPPEPAGVLVTNPPYGERIAVRGADTPEEFFVEFGNALKQRFAGWRCYVLSSDLKLQGKIRLAPSKRTVLYNGALECRLYEFKMSAGSMRARPPVAADATDAANPVDPT